MDYRKIISFGKSSYIISLPKDWVQKNKLKKGDIVSVEDKNDSITLFAQNPRRSDQTEHRTVISVDGKGIGEIKREIIPAYINNNKMIVLVGKEIKEKAGSIQHILHNLMALEIMEQDSDKIVARDFLNMAEISLPEITNKMETITKAMIFDTKKMFDCDLYENVFSRDEDVNRLSYLSYRTIRYALKNPALAAQRYNIGPMELVNFWMLTHHIEAIADEAKRVARYMRRISLPKKEQQRIAEIFGALEKNYADMMKAYYDKNKSLAHAVSARKPEIIAKLNSVYEQNQKTDWIGALTEHMKIMATNIHDLARAVYE